MVASAFWKTIHTPGHDSALVTREGGHWLLRGTAVFRDQRGPVSAAYRVEVDDTWRTLSGTVNGFAGVAPFSHRIERGPDGWVLDDRPLGLGHLLDLDFGFTPATNYLQLKRANLSVGEAAEFSVAWFDIGEPTLIDLPQRYARRDEQHYWYQSPQGKYEAILVMAESGFVKIYPDLWEMED